MKNLILIIGFGLILLNTLFGLIISFYSVFNWLSVDSVLLINTILLHSIAQSKIKDGFKIGITFLFPLLSLVQIIMGIIMNNSIENNIPLVVILLILFIQFFFFVMAKQRKLS